MPLVFWYSEKQQAVNDVHRANGIQIIDGITGDGEAIVATVKTKPERMMIDGKPYTEVRSSYSGPSQWPDAVPVHICGPVEYAELARTGRIKKTGGEILEKLS